ncbi:MAG: hypothetical protein ACTSRK_03575 [Promethearchaeota archaeon]
MNEPESIDRIMLKIKKKWEADPEGWSVLGNVDRDGNREMFINQAPNSYWLKMRTVTAKNQMAYGRELHNIDDEINEKIYGSREKNSGKPIQNKLDLIQLFGMMVPSEKEILYTAGVERFSPDLAKKQKEIIEEKETDADKIYRLYLRKKFQREFEFRENMYL